MPTNIQVVPPAHGHGLVTTAPPYSSSVNVALKTSQDFLDPAGYLSGITNRLILTPATGGSTILGLASAPDGWHILLVNLSSSYSITFPYNQSNFPGCGFQTNSGANQTLNPLAACIITYVGPIALWSFAS